MGYHDFLWKVNYSNGLYVRATEQDTGYKVHIGPGNNSNLVKGIIKRRFWWSLTDKPENCHFVWTQLRVNAIVKDLQVGCSNAGNVYRKGMELQGSAKTEPVAHLQEGHERIFNRTDLVNWNRHMRRYRKSEQSIS